MNKTEILIVGNERDTVEKTVSILNNNKEWNGLQAFSDEEAIAKFQQYPIEIVLLTKDVNNAQEKKLAKLFTFQSPGIIIARLEEGDATSLHNTIDTILKKKKAATGFSFVLIDDALKNAGLNIRVQ